MSESEKMDGDQPARLFISYSHKDEGIAKELLSKHSYGEALII